MQQFGHTRSAVRRDHILQTPDTFVRARLPGMRQAAAVAHIGPAAGARFTQYTAEFSPGGSMAAPSAQRFVYVLEGQLEIGGRVLGRDDYAYAPAGCNAGAVALTAARAAVIEKPYCPLPGVPAPALFTGRESDVPASALDGDEGLQVRRLLPDQPAFDFAVNTMTYRPGAALSMVEIHVMEHGLLMLAGGGIYRLGDCWYPVAAGDFIWMAPYCPQWFGALGKTPARYLIYKDWNRHPLDKGQC
ncbi:MAG TPA: (S)-ureidoglycine aminohydrolase [Candidatus Sulfopaludibacter sp.]|nr:(S)-ureidoglycine aminohydrolase [Candidatus Sulfopaludibacter sp.]